MALDIARVPTPCYVLEEELLRGNLAVMLIWAAIIASSLIAAMLPDGSDAASDTELLSAYQAGFLAVGLIMAPAAIIMPSTMNPKPMKRKLRSSSTSWRAGCWPSAAATGRPSSAWARSPPATGPRPRWRPAPSSW